MMAAAARSCVPCAWVLGGAFAFACLSANAGAATVDYVFTDAPCVHGKAFGSPQQTCRLHAGSPIVAGAAAPIFVTAISGGVPTQLDAAADTPVAMAFALSCHNPASSAGITANYALAVLPPCASNGAVPGTEWSGAVAMVFNAGAATVAAGANFSYADVGKVQLFLRDSANRIVGSLPFVVMPNSLAITAVTRSADGFANPQSTSGAGNGFARAGEALTIRAAALTATGAVAPNFGREGALLTLEAVRGGDGPAQAAMLDLPVLGGSFTSVDGGVFSGAAFTVSDAGILDVTPRLSTNDYLGAGAPAVHATTTIGRFYPDHFDTSIMAPLQCLPHMGCPADVSGASYSAQPFSVTVKPMNAQGGALRNFTGALARPVTLAAIELAGGATPDPAGGALSAKLIGVAAIQPDQPIEAQPVYTLPLPFSQTFGTTPPTARNWSAPTPIYLRASASENVAGGSVTVSSLRTSGSASIEGGVTIVSGRLALANPYGSELMKMPVKAEAQYWSATGRWETNTGDNVSTLQSGGIAFANCQKALKPCGSVLGVTADTTLPMKKGLATFWLKAPGAGKAGSIEFQMNNPAWLPSTVSRAVFGVYRGVSVIYVRELY